MTDLYRIIAYFYIYAFMGWCVEVLYSYHMQKRFVNRGFLKGPVCPIYGLAMLFVITVLWPDRNNIFALYLGSLIIPTAVELMAGIILLKLFGLRWWDYSDMRFNIGGFICLEFSLIWSVLVFIGVKFIHPFVLNLVAAVPPAKLMFFLNILMTLTVFDILLTVMHLIHFKQLIKDIADGFIVPLIDAGRNKMHFHNKRYRQWTEAYPFLHEKILNHDSSFIKHRLNAIKHKFSGRKTKKG
jgi:uncharacterized membrane protein